MFGMKKEITALNLCQTWFYKSGAFFFNFARFVFSVVFCKVLKWRIFVFHGFSTMSSQAEGFCKIATTRKCDMNYTCLDVISFALYCTGFRKEKPLLPSRSVNQNLLLRASTTVLTHLAHRFTLRQALHLTSLHASFLLKRPISTWS